MLPSVVSAATSGIATGISNVIAPAARAAVDEFEEEPAEEDVEEEEPPPAPAIFPMSRVERPWRER